MSRSLSALLLVCLPIGFFSEETPLYRNGFGYSCENGMPNCLPNSCIFDLAGGFFCVECGSEHVPINGTCVSTAHEAVSKAGCAKSPMGGWCMKCGDGYFLFYGGCYELTGEWKAGICDRAEGGVCKECGKGSKISIPIVFTNPNTTSPERCIHCGDPVGFGGYSGTIHCQYCKPPKYAWKTEADCFSCSLPQTMCTFDYRCKIVTSGVDTGYCISCPTTHILSANACFSIDSPIGNSICLPKNIIDITDRSLCVQCTNSSEAPLQGNCVAIAEFSDICVKDTKTGRCTACKNKGDTSYYLFYGGCYSANHGSGEQIGTTICQAAENNICTTCNSSINDVFTKNNGCWRCGDSANGGIEGCQRCEMKDSGLQCLECRDLYLSLDKRSCLASCPKGQKGIQGSPSSTHSCVCDDGSYLKDGKCVGCTVENCAECDESSCKKCKYGYTLSDSQCVATKCKDPNCDTCEDRDVCTKCTDDNSLDPHGLCVKDCLGSAGYYKATVGGVSRCVACTLGNCAVCESESKCKACRDGFYVEGSGGCRPCSSECATCSGPASGDCTSCPARKRL
ncbi:Variant-specific surface protein [Giardia duodenalis]|uniref:Variant-specific surface protein n=1 Tax=Giardia intestinalis TaxID=5741 RepID=V6TFN3_GIAIN|nr:Variant-specific surface protein [Giardia intestinalis]